MHAFNMCAFVFVAYQTIICTAISIGLYFNCIMSHNRYIILLILVIMANHVQAFEYSGIILDKDNSPLSYATVRVLNKPIATLTDSFGIFHFCDDRLSKRDSLEVSFLGYEKSYKLIQVSNGILDTIKLSTRQITLEDLIVYPNYKTKSKHIRQGKKRRGGIIETFLDGNTKGMSYGYEFHTKDQTELILDRVGMYFFCGESFLTKAQFRLMVYDMQFAKISTDIIQAGIFECILPEPVYFNFNFNNTNGYVFEFELPEKIILPKDALVSIEFLEDIGTDKIWYKSNGLAKKTWVREIANGDYWYKHPFATPFFIECIEQKM